jgi:uncharacterized protein (TIGR03545 family)
MFIAGSSPKPGQGGEAPETPSPRRTVFRWRGLIALAAGVVLAAGWWLIFGERTVRNALEEAGTSSLGTEVDIAGLDINVTHTSIALRGIAIADPFDRNQNLVEASVARVELEVDPLLVKKLVVRDFALEGVRTGTRRATPAREVAAGGFAPRAMQELTRWRQQFKVPLLSLTPIDTIKALILDPAQLKTVQAAVALGQRADSLRTGLTNRVQALRRPEVVDSAQALLTRLKGQTIRTLGVTGTISAVRDVRRLTSSVDSLKRAVDAVQRSARNDVDSLVAATRALDDVRREDYAFARGLLALPSFDAPSIGPALFGNVSIDAMQQAMYWVTLAREYAPPGLLPREKSGPSRMRRAGTTVQFVQTESYPAFLMRRGTLTLTLGDATGAARGDYTLHVANLTSDPALVGKPMTFDLQRVAANSGVESLAVTGSIDHVGTRLHDVLDARAERLALPSFALPGLPVRVDLGRGAMTMRMEVDGDAVQGHWSVSAGSAAWHGDTARSAARPVNTLEALVVRILSGISQVDIAADITGTLKAPKLAVRSNLDRAVADGIRSVAGQEIAKAEAKVRAQVDSIAEVKLAPVRARVTELRSEIDDRMKEVSGQIDDLKARLTAQLRALGQ